MDIQEIKEDLKTNIAICIFPSPFLRNKELEEKFMKFTEFYVNRAQCILDLEYHKVVSIDDGLRKYANTYDHILFLAAGVRIYNESVIYDVIDMIEDTLKPGNQPYLAGAHILDWKEDYYELHHQFILVNSKSWLNLGSPEFGSALPGKTELPVIDRSEENFHDDYTPYWVKPTGEYKIQNHNRQGWGFIDAAFRGGYTILNWDKKIRDKRTYYYPESNSERFLECIQKRIVDHDLNFNQRKFLMMDEDVDKQVWVLNSERVDLINDGDQYKCKNIKKVVVPAAGLKPLSVFHQNFAADDFEYVIYDYSETSINWMIHLHKSNSYDFPKMVMEFEDKEYLRVIHQDTIISHTGELIKPFFDSLERSIAAFGGEDNYKKYLDKFRSTKISFVRLDLINNFEKLLTYLNPTDNYISVSNIFCTDYVNAFADLDHVRKRFALLLQTLPEDTYFAGFSPSSRFFSNTINKEEGLMQYRKKPLI